MNSVVFLALIATVGTWSVTALGAATVVFFKSPNTRLINAMLGFASGVMIAASFWSSLRSNARRHAAVRLPTWWQPPGFFAAQPLCGCPTKPSPAQDAIRCVCKTHRAAAQIA